MAYLKKFSAEIYWMAGYARLFLPPLLFLVIGGGMLSLCGVGFALASRNLIDTATGAAQGNFLHTGVVMGLIIIIQIALQSAYTMVSARVLEQTGNRLRGDLFGRLVGTEWMPFSKYHSGDVVARLTSDISSVANAITGLVPQGVTLGVQMLAAFLVLYHFDPVMAALAFILGPVLIIFGRLYGRRIKQIQVRCQESESKTRSFLQEVLQNMLVVKSFNLGDTCSGRFKELQSQHLMWVMKRNWLGMAAGAGLSLGFWLGYFLALTWGSYRLSTGMITFGTMAVFLQLVGQVQGPFLGLARLLPRTYSAMASAGRLMELEGLPLEEKCADDGDLKHSSSLAVGLTLQDITFGYHADANILDKLSMEVRAGEIVAITGASGAGKTTLMRLLLALITPSQGEVLFTAGSGEGVKASADARRYISYVPQRNILFTGTIEENLKMGCPEATPAEIVYCAVMARAWDFISALPEQLGTVIGEHGLGLSEGQVQRLAIARALLRRAPILLLDEATSALDAETEAKVLQAISSLGRTCIIVTHRPMALEYCDRVLQIRDGGLVEVKRGASVWNTRDSITGSTEQKKMKLALGK